MEIILLALLSLFVFYRLWTVLGTRTGEEKKHDWAAKAQQEMMTSSDGDNIIVLPNRKNPLPEAINEKNESPFVQNLRQIKEHDPTFDEDGFLRGSSRAFEKIVLAYANADYPQLKKLLSKDVYTKFVDAINAREERNQKLEASIDSVDATIVDVKLTKTSASITVRFYSQQMLATVDADGVSFDNPARLKTNVEDFWTFKRTFSSSSSMWTLVKTESKHV
ncbi:MAG: Tim44/TimA family putative adaptor protein [Candidatus Paracaedibacteraceae bacterium]|nr:Tim44/TimA family putative adaptor protein [Candidatus Paracaedibacteraceae bacterium]